MLRRDFIKSTGCFFAASKLSASDALAQGRALESRAVLPINRNWRFHPSKVEGAHLPSFTDSAFERVVIPHTNVKQPWHNFDDKEYQFISTYRRRFQYPTAARGKRVFVDFEGVMTASTVWINGVPLGEYKGGFTPFSFELTPHLRINGENILVVQVDSTERADIPAVWPRHRLHDVRRYLSRSNNADCLAHLHRQHFRTALQHSQRSAIDRSRLYARRRTRCRSHHT